MVPTKQNYMAQKLMLFFNFNQSSQAASVSCVFATGGQISTALTGELHGYGRADLVLLQQCDGR